MSNTQTINLGIIGCGIASRELHWPPLKELQEKFRITAVCNHTAEKAKTLSALVGDLYKKDIPWFLDYNDLLAREDVDAVAILLPVEKNLEVCTAAARAGKHILVEKPMAHNREAADALMALEQEFSSLTMAVAENFRYREIYGALSDLIFHGKIGTPYFIDWHYWQQMVTESNIYAGTKWRIDHKYEGGFLTDGGIHNIAVLRDQFGELEFLGTATDSINKDIGRVDSLFALFRTSGKGGIPPMTGHLNLGFSVNGLGDYTIRVLGSEGSLTVGWDTIALWQNREGKVQDKPVESWTYSSSGGYKEEYLDFYHAVTTGEKPLSSFKEGRSDLETILRAVEG